MFPFNFEWVWDIAHVIFFGALWYSLAILGAGMAFVIVKSAMDTMNDSGEPHH